MVGVFRRKKLFSSGDSRFFDLLSRQSSKGMEGLEALWTYAENSTQENANVVRNLEREADELRRVLIQELDQRFVTFFWTGRIFMPFLGP